MYSVKNRQDCCLQRPVTCRVGRPVTAIKVWISLSTPSAASLRVGKALDAQQSSSSVVAQFDPEQLVLGKCPQFAIATKAKIGTPALDLDLAD